MRASRRGEILSAARLMLSAASVLPCRSYSARAVKLGLYATRSVLDSYLNSSMHSPWIAWILHVALEHVTPRNGDSDDDNEHACEHVVRGCLVHLM